MDEHALERLGHNIVSRRIALGFRNRTDLADSLQFTVGTLSDIENGVRKASPPGSRGESHPPGPHRTDYVESP